MSQQQSINNTQKQSKIRIAFMVFEFPILSETFVLNQIAGMLERGCEVDIYAERRGDTDKVHPLVKKYALQERTYYLPELPENLFVRLIKGIRRIFNYALVCPLQLWRALYPFPLTDLTLSLWLLHTVIPNLKQNYDIIHCQFGTQSYRGMAFRQVNAPTAKLITTFRGHDISSFVQQKGKNVYKQLFRYGDFFLTNCDFFRNKAISLGCPPDKIKVNRSGLNCDRFAYQPRSLPKDSFIQITTTGRLVEKKGIEYVIRAIAQLIPTHPHLSYKVIGEGHLRSHFTQLIQELKLTENVELMGWCNETEIVEILKHTHIFVAPSITATDGNQDAPINVLKEAMAIGLPVISTYHGGIPELVEDGISGFLVPERDVQALVDKLSYLIKHPEKWSAMGKAGRDSVLKNYNLTLLNDDLVKVYRTLIDSDKITTIKT
ncbi:MAG: glycosyltransferase [Xenococcaceae cyanobacterium MO_167.B52]|nr:glycosyltransferase [Xenococcaceae cyanobacterium MO_167.B52]